MERMVVYLRQNLEWLELNGLPRFVDEKAYPLSTCPARHRFQEGDDVLVWSQRSNESSSSAGGGSPRAPRRRRWLPFVAWRTMEYAFP